MPSIMMLLHFVYIMPVKITVGLKTDVSEKFYQNVYLLEIHKFAKVKSRETKTKRCTTQHNTINQNCPFSVTII